MLTHFTYKTRTPNPTQPKLDAAPTSSQLPTETVTAKDPAIGKVEEVTPIVTAVETCILTTEDWEAETIDVPEQPVEQKPSEEWVMVNAEDAASVEPAVPEEKAMKVAFKSEADEQLKEKVFPEVPVESHPEQSKVGEEKADTVEEQLPSTSEQKTETAKAEKRDQPPQVAEEEKEEGEISSDDDTENVPINEAGHKGQEGTYSVCWSEDVCSFAIRVLTASYCACSFLSAFPLP